MKKFCLLLLALLAAALPVAAQHAPKIIMDDEDMTIYGYSDIGRCTDGSLSFWFKEVYKTPQIAQEERQNFNLPKTPHAKKMQYRFSRDWKQYYLDTVIFYDDNGWLIGRNAFYPKEGWQDVQPDTWHYLYGFFAKERYEEGEEEEF